MTPVFQIRHDDKDITAKVKDRLVEMRVVTTADSASDYVELVLDDREGDLKQIPSRARLIIKLGYAHQKQLRDMGTFIASTTEFELNPRRMVVRATAADFSKLSTLKAPKSRYFDDITLGELVDRIAEEHGYEGACSPALAGTEIPHLDQTSESDLHLLRRLSIKYDATFKAAARKLVFVPRGAGLSARLQKQMPVVTVAPGDGIRGRVTRQERSHYGAVVAKYHDYDLGKTVPVKVGDGEPVLEIPAPRANRADAEADAKARLARQQRETGTLTLNVGGNPDLVAEGRVKMEGWRDGVDGLWTVVRAEHILNKRGGYKCQVKGEPVLG